MRRDICDSSTASDFPLRGLAHQNWMSTWLRKHDSALPDGSTSAEGLDAAGEEQRRRRRRRGGRGNRDEAGSDVAANGAEASGAADAAAPAVDGAATPVDGVDGAAPEAGEGGERDGSRRRGRGRDRTRRERRDEDGGVLADGSAQPEAAIAAQDGAMPQAAPLAGAGADIGGSEQANANAQDRADAVAVVAAPAPLVAPLAAPTARPAEPVAVAAPAPRVAEPFVLPIDTLQDLAASSGLQWVNSDAEKIRAAQAAMAAEPAPVHVPRERPPLVVIDEGPLVLVETRKDLSQLKLPFETGGGAPAAPQA